jgi:hypothetical protein
MNLLILLALIGNPGGEYFKGKCIGSAYLNCVATQKIDQTHIAIECDMVHGPAVVWVDGSPPPMDYRRHINIGLWYTGTERVELDNGFETTVDIFNECPWPPKQR